MAVISNSVTSLRILLLVPLYALIVLWPTDDARRWAALAVFLRAGLTVVLDGFLARRLNEVSVFGAMLDLFADRLLTTVALLALMASGVLQGWPLLAGGVLIARDLIVASLNEALPGRLAIRVTPLERVKITFQFLGLGLLIAPEIAGAGWPAMSHTLGRWALGLGALLALMTLADYLARAVRAVRTPVKA
jgi:CDP-diacylglycerol--glycerol-3-phosphate 3-phosphatidyltransferase